MLIPRKAALALTSAWNASELSNMTRLCFNTFIRIHPVSIYIHLYYNTFNTKLQPLLAISLVTGLEWGKL